MPNNRQVRVMHIIDTLQAGGAERVAVNLTNELAKRGYTAYLCVTRKEGPLKFEILPTVNYLFLGRSNIFDIRALSKLILFIKQNHIDIIHAHSSSIFLARLVNIFLSLPKTIWHDHYGMHSIRKRSVIIYKLLLRGIDGVIAVNRSLLDWAINTLKYPEEKAWYLPNFIVKKTFKKIQNLPGIDGFRCVCVGHLRPQKDQITLIRAMRIVVDNEPNAHLLLIGAIVDADYAKNLFATIDIQKIKTSITWLGSRNDVENIISSCDVGIISSESEGLPLVLLEYGNYGLSVISTNVGECQAVLDYGRSGIIVSPGSPEELAEGILELLRDKNKRLELSDNFKMRVELFFGMDTIMAQLERIYEKITKDLSFYNDDVEKD